MYDDPFAADRSRGMQQHMKRLIAFAAAGVAVLTCGLVSAADAPPPGVTTPCRIDGISTQVRCGVLQRPLNPAQPGGAKVDIHYVVVPALARRKWSDPVFFFAGGPGQSAIAIAPAMVGAFNRLNNRRDLVFIDQRGTGRSAPLQCATDRRLPLAQQIDPARRAGFLDACLQSLKKHSYGDLRYFTTEIASRDVDAVRVALGADTVNVVGASYGTRAALDYMRQFPSSVRRSVLDGVAPPDMVLPLSMPADTQAALDAWFEFCEKTAACAKAHPQLRQQWRAVLAGLPRSVILEHPVTGQGEQVVLTREAVLGWVRSPLYVPAYASALPLAIGEAAQGRWSALMGLGGVMSGQRSTELALGMHLSVVCAEDFPRMSVTSGEPPANTDFGTMSAELYTQACAKWPRGTVSNAFYQVDKATTPTLVMSGAIDPVTPPRHGKRVTDALGTLAQHVVVPNAGHGVMTLGCMRDVVTRFIDAKENVLPVDAACVDIVPKPQPYIAYDPTRSAP